MNVVGAMNYFSSFLFFPKFFIHLFFSVFVQTSLVSPRLIEVVGAND
jgi:hypothetical protein